MNDLQKQLLELKEPKIVDLNGKIYLGFLKSGLLECALHCTDPIGDDKFSEWVANYNIENLQKIQISRVTSYTSRTLNDREKSIFQFHKQLLLQAKRFALEYWENEVYKRLVKESLSEK